MFTGIIEEVGTITAFDRGIRDGRIRIQCNRVLEGTKRGDSIAVNGICLTVTDLGESHFCADVMAETVRMSSLGNCIPGSKVNLERAMALGDRFGGHIVSGHIDGTGKIVAMEQEENAIWVTIQSEEAILEQIVLKGSVAIDGISLTVARKGFDTFAVSVIPTTGRETTLLQKRVGDSVNLENDMIGKYVKALLHPYASAPDTQSGLTMEKLQEWGF